GMQAKTDAARPRIFGALLDLLAGGLRMRGKAKLTRNVRMSDFVTHCEECFQAAGREPEWFLKLFEAMRGETVAAPLGDWPVYPHLLCLLDASKNEFSGTATNLLKWLNKTPDAYEARRLADWPKTPNGLSGQLTRHAQALEAAGVSVRRERVGNQ